MVQDIYSSRDKGVVLHHPQKFVMEEAELKHQLNLHLSGLKTELRMLEALGLQMDLESVERAQALNGTNL